MLGFRKSIFLLLLLVLSLTVRQVYAVLPEEISDVRILIDVSGSMKKNDPNNLRSPALRLVVGLLPEGAKSGVWTFGKYVNMLVPLRDVNEDWKLEAEIQSQNIHSRGLFTNIEQALDKAGSNQSLGDSHYRRSIILLSDGLVDISKNKQLNEKSRQRILDKIVPVLKNKNIAVHTIALSDNADHALLRSISLATDGWYEQVDSAEELQRVFLHLFEKAAKRDTVPLLDNHFKIDDSVTEMTLLVFHPENSKETTLLLPDQSRVTFQERSDEIRWHNESTYDLITIDNPLSGTWQIDADVDPDNRVMIVTDLKLQATDLPNNILIGETFDFDSSLTEKSTTIINQDFLDLVDVQLKEESEIADPIETSLNKDRQQGVFRTHVGERFHPGRNDVVITFKSATFERQRRQSINVVETPFDINVEQLLDQKTRTHRLNLKPDIDLIKAENLSIAAMLTAEDGSEWSYDVMKSSELEWQLTLADLQAGEQYRIALQIRGETVKGRSLFLQPDIIVLNDETVIQQEDDLVKEPILAEPVDAVMPEGDELDIDSQRDDILLEPIIDEMADFDDILPEADDDDFGQIEQLNDSQVTDENTLSSTMTLMIGNGIILLVIMIVFFLWRRKQSARIDIGEQL